MVQTWVETDETAEGDTVKTGLINTEDKHDTQQSCWSGSTAPSDSLTVIGQLWADTSSTPVLKFLESKSPDVWKIVVTQGDAQVNPATLATDAVETAKIDDLAVTTAKIALLGVDTAQLAADAVETAKIDDLAVTTAKIALLGVDTAQLAASAVEAAKIATSAVETDKINALAVTEAKIGAAAVTEAKLGTDAVTTAKIADQNVTAAKMKATGSDPFVFGKRSTDSVPVEVPLSEVQGDAGRYVTALPNSISKGAHTMAVLTIDDEIWTIGSCTHGSPQIASGRADNYNWTPVIFDAPRGTIDKFYLSSHSGFAIDSNGDVWAWGGNANGQLGLGDLVRRNVATQITALSGVNVDEVIVADFGHGDQDSTFFITDTGAVWCCGYNLYGQLGMGDTTQRSTATLNTSLTSIEQISYSNSGRGHCISRDTSGAVKTWGYNGHGQLGDGTTTNQDTPTTVGALTGVDFVKAIAQEWSTGSRTHAVDGATMDSAGYNAHGCLGDTTTTQRTTFVAATIGGSPADIVDIQGSEGFQNGILRDSAGDLYSAGHNTHGTLGLGDTAVHSASGYEAVTMPSTTAVKHFIYNGISGNATAMFLGADGELYATGYNLDGSLGQGTVTALSSFTQVIRFGSETLTDLIIAGGHPTLGAGSESAAFAIDASGTLYAVGNLGDLGIGLPISDLGNPDRSHWFMVPVPVI